MQASNKKTQNRLTREQKEAIGLLSIGTFLEYFDLMLYVHLAVLLNDLFFPQSDPTTKYLLSATAFSMTFILRPVGGFVIGRVGDALGRKVTIIITTFSMASACLVMANIGTYDEIGITATITIILCRMLQGFSSLGEIMGATLYLTETLQSPYKYIASAIIDTNSRAGGLFALIVAYFALSSQLDWRLAFWIGSIVAVLGTVARTRLRETPEFANHQLRLQRKEEHNKQYVKIEKTIKYKENIDVKTVLGLFFNTFLTPVSVYITYIYLGNFAKTVLGMSPEQVISHNLKVSICSVFASGVIAYLCKKYHPIDIVRVNIYVFAIALLFIPYWLYNIPYESVWLLFGLQCLTYIPCITNLVKISIWIKHYPINKRFTITATIFGVASAFGYGIASFAILPLTNQFGYYGLWIICIPSVISFIWGLNYLKKLEIKKGIYYNYPHEDPSYLDTAINEKDFNYTLTEEYEKYQDKCKYSTQFLNKLHVFSEEKNKKVNIKLIKKSIIFAKKWHAGQMRKTGNIPYYSHPLEVALNVAKYYLKTDVIVATVLHDVVEDSDATIEMIEKEFNPRIAQIVARLTKIRYINSKRIKLTLKETIEELYAANDYEALFIKKFDRVHNLETIEGLSDKKKQTKMAEETNNFLVGTVALVAEKLGIHKKIYLEDKVFKIAHDILSGKK